VLKPDFIPAFGNWCFYAIAWLNFFFINGLWFVVFMRWGLWGSVGKSAWCCRELPGF
jgi:hypothetical protein